MATSEPNPAATVYDLNRDVMALVLSLVPCDTTSAASLTCKWWYGLLETPSVRDAIAMASPGYDAQVWSALLKTASLSMDIKRMVRRLTARSRSKLIKSIIYCGDYISFGAFVTVSILDATIQIELMTSYRTAVRSVGLSDVTDRDAEFSSIVDVMKNKTHEISRRKCPDCLKSHPVIEVYIHRGFFHPDTMSGPDMRHTWGAGTHMRCSFDGRNHNYGFDCRMSLCAFVLMFK